MEDKYFYGIEKEIVSSMTEWLVENIEAVTSEEEKKKNGKLNPVHGCQHIQARQKISS